MLKQYKTYSGMKVFHMKVVTENVRRFAIPIQVFFVNIFSWTFIFLNYHYIQFGCFLIVPLKFLSWVLVFFQSIFFHFPKLVVFFSIYRILNWFLRIIDLTALSLVPPYEICGNHITLNFHLCGEAKNISVNEI